MKIGFCLLILFSLPVFAWDVMDNQFLSFGEAEKLWNIEPYESARFQQAKPDERGGMALDLINKGTFNSRRMIEVRKALGTPDGKFQARGSLAYRLGSDDRNSYQLVFLPDFSGKSVENIKIMHEPNVEAATVHSSSQPVKPTTVTSISAGSKRLPIEIEGPLAQSIYVHLHVPESRSVKTGKNIACSHLDGRYRCSLEIDEKGESFAKP